MRFAQNTEVSVERSRNEIERTLSRYGAEGFTYGWQGQMAVVTFDMRSKRIAFFLPLPDKAQKEFWFTPSQKHKRTPEAAEREWEQACRQRWRALSLAIKAKLEAVEAGITDFEHEFLAHIVLPNGKTLGSQIVPQIERAYLENKMPPLLGYSA